MRREAHWLGHGVQLAESAGGVLAFVDPWEGLVRGGVEPWPPAELVQKLYQSRQARAFRGADAVAVKQSLGYYCDLQSVHSEDAITWSLFGPLVYSAPEVRRSFAERLLIALGHPAPVQAACIWLWRRLPHPEGLVSGGPEVDFGIQTDSALMLGEAKWGSEIGRGQGKAKDKDQVDLRLEFCRKYGTQLFPQVRTFVVLIVGPAFGQVTDAHRTQAAGPVTVHETTWEVLARLSSHPSATEFQKQLVWRWEHSRLRGLKE